MKKVKLSQEEMDALITNKILSTGNEMYVDTIPYFKINNELVKPRPMLSKKKKEIVLYVK